MVDVPAPWHHWPLALLAVLFYGIGVFDFMLTGLDVSVYTDRFTAEQMAFTSGLAGWLNWVWALSVFAGLFGAILLWRRNRFSVLMLFVGFVLLTFLTLWTTFFSRPSLTGVMGFDGLYILAGTCALAFVFYIYARWERHVRKL